MREKLQVDVPLAVAGESPAVKRGEGDLLQTVHSVRVECLPGDIPEQLELDVSGLDSLEAGIRAGELRLAPGVTLLTDADELLVKVTPRRELAAEVEEAPEPAEAAAEEPGEAPAPGEPGEES
jgi:large subunit ribosomal protein L25